jgi:hypothetical protein
VPQQLKRNVWSNNFVSTSVIGHEREPRRDNQASGFLEALKIRVSPEKDRQGQLVSVSAKRQTEKANRKGIRPRASHMRSQAVITAAKRWSWKNWRIVGGMQWSVSNRNGGSHMMLDNKTEQK